MLSLFNSTGRPRLTDLAFASLHLDSSFTGRRLCCPLLSSFDAPNASISKSKDGQLKADGGEPRPHPDHGPRGPDQTPLASDCSASVMLRPAISPQVPLFAEANWAQ